MQKFLIHEFDTYGREPILRRMPGGLLVCLFLSGGPTEPHNENRVLIARSRDDGETWTRPEVLFSHSARGVWATELFADCPRPFIAVHTYNAESHYRELNTFLSFTEDGGETWSDPAPISGGFTGATLRQGIEISSGEWLFPLYWQEARGGFDWAKGDCGYPAFCCGVAITADEGRSWQRFGDLRMEDSGLWEPNCVELEPGQIVMMMRSTCDAHLQVSESFDFGRSWSEPVPSVLPNPGTKVTLLSAQGRVLLVNNFSNQMGWDTRTKLQLWVSDDMMRSWKTKIALMPQDEPWFYPHGFADDARRTLYLAAENGRRHVLLKIPYDELEL